MSGHRGNAARAREVALPKPVVLAIALLAGPVWASAAPLVAARVETPPRIDGRLDDAVWQQANATTAFTQAQPVAGSTPTRRTELRWVHDGRVLYVAVRAFDRQPELISSRTLCRDAEATVNVKSAACSSMRNGFGPWPATCAFSTRSRRP